MPTRRHLLRGAVAAAVAAAGLALAASANAAALVPIDPSPANGLRIQTTDRGADVAFAWTGDTTGCTGAPFSGRLVFTGPRPFTRGLLSSAIPTGSETINFRTAVVDDTFSWYVSMSCAGVPGEIRSETRSFTLVPPEPNPRLDGSYLANARGSSSSTWRLTPGCPGGACDTTLKIPAIRAFLLKYNPTTRQYKGSVGGAKGTCRKSFFITYRNAYKLRLTVQARVTGTQIVGAQTYAQTLTGKLISRFTPNAKGRRHGCKAVTRTQPLSLSRR